MAEYWALVPAAGAGRRMQAGIPKQYLQLAGKPILEHTLQRLLACPGIRGVLPCIAAEDRHWAAMQVDDPRLLPAARGGPSRAVSALNGLRRLSEFAAEGDWVLVHDAVRPCVSVDALQRLMAEAGEDPCGGILALPVTDTLKRGDAHRRIQGTQERGGLWRAQTPQMFRLGALRAALQTAIDVGATITDEAGAMELAGQRPLLVRGEATNIKITLPEDLPLAETIFARRAERT